VLALAKRVVRAFTQPAFVTSEAALVGSHMLDASSAIAIGSAKRS
jgi:hypothetical protein